MTGRTLRVAALYPERLNIYADRGNLLVLQRRCAWRGIAMELVPVSLGDRLDPDAHDLLYLGGGQDRDQRLCAEDLVATKRDAVHAHAARGGAILAVCGGYQLLGHRYALGPDEALPGVGLLDVSTDRGDARLIGNVAIEVRLPRPGGDGAPMEPRVLAGFENHGGRTVLGPDQQPLGRVLEGHGNTGTSGHEGARSGNVVGTYLHGPLLPKNAWFADWLVAAALDVDPDALGPLDDTLEDGAHRSARRAAGLPAG
ncbi:MAG: glutamine amidotransferase [Solirubrobacteraceae bacterium]|nr:glutamine amidotransferase [Solirubrobacteraceae bacterium]